MKPSVCIIGAGPAGLALALSFQRHGLARVSLFEARPDHELARSYDPTRSYAIDLTGHGMRALDALGVRQRCERELLPFKGVKFYLGVNGRDPHREPGLVCSRADLCRALLRELRARDMSDIDVFFDTPASLVEPLRGEVRIGDDVRTFDLVCGADGAGSGMRSTAGIAYTSGGYSNHSTMLRFDRQLARLDPTWLYMFGAPPVMIVAGAINGNGGRDEPLWFCQVSTDGPLRFDSVFAAKAYLQAHAKRLLPFLSDTAIAEFASAPSTPTGRWKTLERLAHGRCVFVGDAGAPFPPIGQGANAALASAIALDAAIAENPSDLLVAARAYEGAWMPEARAATAIAMKLDIRVSRLIIVKTLLYTWLGLAGVQNAKKRNWSYRQALARERWADLIFASALAAAFFGVAAWVVLSS